MNRPKETVVERAGRLLSNQAELTLMLYKTYADADTEAKKIAKELEAAKKINSKKKTQPLTDSKEREK